MSIDRSIYMGDQKVGIAECDTEGLYQIITCQCNLPDSSIYRLELRYPNQVIPLGVCVPSNHGYLLRKRIPVKQLRQGDGKVYVVGTSNMNWIPITRFGPFDHLTQLPMARFQSADGKAYIQLNTSED